MSRESEVKIKFGASTTEAEQGARQVAHALQELGGVVPEIIEKFEAIGAAIAGAFALHEIAEFIDHMGELGEQAVRSSQMLGIAVEEVQRFQAAVELTGGNADAATTIMTRLARNIEEAAGGAGKAYDAFTSLGISVRDQEGNLRSVMDVLYEISARFAETEDGTLKTAYGFALMGRGGAEMLPLLNQNAEEIKRLGEEAERTGVVLNAEMAHRFAETGDNLKTLQMAFRGVGIEIFNQLQPAFDAAITGIKNLMVGFKDLIRDSEVLRAAVIGGAAIWQEFAAAVKAAYDVIKNSLMGVASISETVAEVMKKALALDFEGAKAAWTEGMERLKEIAHNAASEVVSEFDKANQSIQGVKHTVLTQGGSETPEEKKEKKAQLPAMRDSAKEKADAAAAAKYQEDEEKRILQLKLDDIRIEQEANKNNYQYVMRLEDQKLALLKEKYGEDSHEYKTAVLEKIRMNDQYVRAALQGFRQVFNAMASATASSLMGMLKGVETWQQALANIFDAVLESFIQMLVKMMVEWAFAQIFTGGTLGGIGAGGSSFGILTSIPKFDVGAWELPSDTLAHVHKGEMIVPPNQAAAIRNGEVSLGRQSGGDTYHINAVDAHSFVNLIKNNASAIANVVRSENRNFSPAVPAWRGA